MKIIYCDNDKVQLSIFERNFSRFLTNDVLTLTDSPAEIYKAIYEGDSPDIVLMDINLGTEINGIDHAAEIFRLSPVTRIIYVTAYTGKYVQDVFLTRANVSGFLTKPLDGHYVSLMLEKARHCAAESRPKKFAVSFRNTVISVNESDVYYIESQKHMIRIVAEDKTYEIYGKMSELLGRLSDGFAVCHKSFAVNFGKIKTLESGRVVLENGVTIPVSRSRYAGFKTAYLDYLRRMA